jgi:hypothetical protein
MGVRRMSRASLENLKLGAKSRKQGKVRVTVTILPETKAWLEKNGNLSGRIDEMVTRYLKKDLVFREEYNEMLDQLKLLKELVNKIVPD